MGAEPTLDWGNSMADPRKPRAPFAPWDRRELPGSFGVEESARRVGHYKWIEMRLFEVLGGWVATVPELDVKMRLGTHCYHHAWHADLWHKRLPELREMNPERLTVPANDAVVAFIDALTEPEAPEHTIEKLVGVFRVLIPHKIAAYTYHLNNTSRITDAPTIRSLGHALQDEFEDWRDGEMMIQSLIETPAEVRRAATHQARLETLLLAAGGIAGPGTLGDPWAGPLESDAPVPVPAGRRPSARSKKKAPAKRKAAAKKRPKKAPARRKAPAKRKAAAKKRPAKKSPARRKAPAAKKKSPARTSAPRKRR